MASGNEKMRIAVMGATGSGKSTFINTTSGSNLAVCDSLESCTIDVETSTFFLDKRTVTLIDTPGFDDTIRSDADVLKSITDYLSVSYGQGVRLTGLIYMHRITDNKMGGPSRKNFHIFRKLCGDRGLQNVLIVTNMWNKVDPDDGEARERELANKEKFFKPAIDKGARMFRHDGSEESGHAIIRHLFDREPSTLLVQNEMVDQEKDLAHTTAGEEIVRDLKEQAERHAQALEDLCLGIEASKLEEDDEEREILQEEARKARERIEQTQRDLERMVTNFAAENSRLASENLRYRKSFGTQKADAEQKAELLERERKARELAEAGKRRAEAQLATERESWEREKRERERVEHEQQERERQEHDRQDRERQERERQERERQERERRERDRQERERQEREKQERERRERREKERELREEMERTKQAEEKGRCLIQ